MAFLVFGVGCQCQTCRVDDDRFALLDELAAFLIERIDDEEAQHFSDYSPEWAARTARTERALIATAVQDAKADPSLLAGTVDSFRARAMKHEYHPDFDPLWRIN